MSWVDAIVYALILVWFVFNFVGQNYSIPTSSLEKTLLTGDYIFVNKLVYGPRVPMTPIHFPLVHNTMPILGCDSYLEWPSVEYRRLAGLRSVERGDIVVFNFPAGDTILTKVQNPDYYQLMWYGGNAGVNGYNYVNANSDELGTKRTRPVDRRENYVKRCVALPGEWFKIVDDVIYIDGVAQPVPKNAQFRYLVRTTRQIDDSLFEQLGVSPEDRNMFRYQGSVPQAYLDEIGLPLNPDGSVGYIYELPLTQSMLAQLKATDFVTAATRYPDDFEPMGIYPFNPYTHTQEHNWTRSNYGGDGIQIPAKGLTVALTRENWLLYERPIRVYEGNTSACWNDREGKVYIDGKPADSYTFAMDYYFMMGDNRDNSLDSRYWGFVPEDHVVGTPVAVLASFDKDKSIFGGKIRFDRIFRNPNPDKKDYIQ